MNLPLVTDEGAARFMAIISDLADEWADKNPVKIRAECQDSLIKFCEHFLSHHFTIDFCSFHTELLNDLSSDNANKRLARIAPRGHGKTTLCALAYPLWCICTGRKRHALIFGSNQELASEKLIDIITELECNVLLRNAYPMLRPAKDQKSQYVKYTDSHIVLEGGVDIMAKGMGAATRGVKPRRDLIIIDDPEKDMDLDSPANRDKNKKYFNKVIRFLGGPGRSLDILAIDTLKHFDSLIQYICDKPGWDSKKYSAVVNEDEKEVLWPHVYCYDVSDLEVEEVENWSKRGTPGHDDIREPFYGRLSDENGKLLIIGIADEEPESFNQEYLSQPIHLSAMPLRSEFWRTFPYSNDLPLKMEYRIGALDISMGKKSGDYQALAAVGSTRNDYYLLDASLSRIDLVGAITNADSLANLCIAFIKRYQLRMFIVEDNGAQALFLNTLAKLMNEQELQCGLRGFPSTTNKIERISMGLGLIMQRGSFHIRADWNEAYPDFMRQFEHFPKGDHDDAPDVTNMAIMGIQRMRS